MFGSITMQSAKLNLRAISDPTFACPSDAVITG